MIYFARDPLTGLIKIGSTEDVKNRMSTLRSLHPGAELLVEAPGCRPAEAALHTMFWSQHVRSEWFHPSAELLALIESVRDGSFVVAALPKVVSPLRRAAGIRSHQTRRANLQRRAA